MEDLQSFLQIFENLSQKIFIPQKTFWLSSVQRIALKVLVCVENIPKLMQFWKTLTKSSSEEIRKPSCFWKNILWKFSAKRRPLTALISLKALLSTGDLRTLLCLEKTFWQKSFCWSPIHRRASDLFCPKNNFKSSCVSGTYSKAHMPWESFHKVFFGVSPKAFLCCINLSESFLSTEESFLSTEDLWYKKLRCLERTFSSSSFSRKRLKILSSVKVI